MVPQSNTAPILEDIKIVNVNCNQANYTNINLTVLNNGAINCSLSTVYITNENGDMVYVYNINVSGAQDLAPGYNITIPIPPFNASPSIIDQPITLSVVTTSGLVVSQLYAPPTTAVSQSTTGESGNQTQTFSISGIVFNDTALTGIYNSSDANLTYCPMELVDNSTGTVYPVQYTSSTGYIFTGLDKGIYTVIVGQPPHPQGTTWLNTTASSYSVVISSQSVTGVDFGYFLTTGSYNLTGEIFNDSYDNGILEPNDAGLSGGVVAICTNGNFYSTATNSNGSYTLLLPAGYYYDVYDYLNSSVNPQGWMNTTPWATQIAIANSNVVLNFGNYWVGINSTTKYTITGTVFNDSQQKGGNYNASDPTESPLNWTVMISDGTHPLQGTTAVNGVYSFSEPNGTYTVMEVRQVNWLNTTPYYATVTVAGQTVKVDFGNYYNPPPDNIYNISGVVFQDINKNGVYNSSIDPVLSNLAVYYSENGTNNVYATQCINGTYQFTQLTPGVYNVYMDNPTSPWTNTTPLLQTVTITSQSVSANFGFYYAQPLNLTGYFFNDTNVNGVYDPGIDNLLANYSWVVHLAYSNGSAISSGPAYVSINSSGYYSFTNLSAGSYTVTAAQQSPWEFTTPQQVNFTITTSSATVNFGVVVLQNMSGYLVNGIVFNDTTASGIYDSTTDNGIPSALITLNDTCGNSYTFETSSLGTYTAGTLLPSGLVAFVPIYIVNTQSTAVAGGTPVNITVDWAAYSSYLDNPVDNYVFFNGSGAVLNSWLQSGTSSTSTNATVWVKLDPNGVPSLANGGYVIIYLGFYPKGDNVLSATGATGWAPTLSSSYAKYDNGNNVFSFYDNFAGTSLNTTNWGTQLSSEGSVKVNNGITFNISTSSDWSYIYSKNTYTAPLVAEVDYTNNTGLGMPFIAESTSGNNNVNYNTPYNSYNYYWIPTADGYTNQVGLEYSTSTSGAELASSDTAFNAGIWALSWSKTGAEMGTNGINTLSGTDSSLTMPSSYAVVFGLSNQAGADTLNVQWVRMRIAPPNNVMPTATFGSLETPSNTTLVSLHPGLWTATCTYAGLTNSTPSTVTFTITNQNVTINFGLYNSSIEPAYAIGGMKFNDTNSDGIYESGTDVPIAGWTIWLYSGPYESEFGQTAVEASSLNVSQYFVGANFTFSGGSGKSALSITAALKSTSTLPQNITVGLYNASKPYTLLASSTLTNVVMTSFFQWYTFNFSSLALTNGSSYLLAITATNNGGSVFAAYTTGQGSEVQASNSTAPYRNPLPSSYPSSFTSETYMVSIYCTYTPASNSAPFYPTLNTLVATTTTNSSGYYSFTGLHAGTYTVMEVPLTGWSNTTSTQSYTVTFSNGSTNDWNLNFGDHYTSPTQLYNVTVQVFDDFDQNGIYNSTIDNPLSGWTVYLFDSYNLPIANATTGSNGQVTFTNIANGSYTVMEAIPSGWTNSTPSSQSFTINNQNVTYYQGTFQVTNSSFTFYMGNYGTGNKPTYAIAGTKYNYSNNTGISGWSIWLYQGNYTTGQSTPYEKTTTNSNGNYSFNNLAAGSYTLIEVMQSGWSNMTALYYNVTITNSSIFGLNFYNQYGSGGSNQTTTYVISGTIFNDLNQSGIDYRSVDPNMSSWTVYIDNSLGFPMGYTTTNGSGYYSFTGLWNSTYIVYYSMGSGYYNSTPQFVTVTIAGQNDTTNFGVYSGYTLGGIVFNDTNATGQYSASDAGISGWTVYLYKGSYTGAVTGTPTSTTTTNSNGNYTFSGLTMNTDYTVVESLRSGWTNTTVRSVILNLTGSTYVNFGDTVINTTKTPLYTISGMKFLDNDQNGIYNSIVDGVISGWTFWITDSSGLLMESVTTNSSGYYSFSVPAGTYWIYENPGSYHNSTAAAQMVTITNQSVTNVNFGNYLNSQKLYALYGTVHNDTSSNGVYNSSDPPMSGQSVMLYSIIGGVAYYNATYTTGANGVYDFQQLPAGIYQLTVSAYANYTFTTPETVQVTITNSSIETDFGMYYNPYAFMQFTISGVVYNDTLQNGHYNSSVDALLSNVPLTITYGSNFYQTDAINGTFCFSGLSQGTYTINEVPLSGYVNSTPTEVVVNITTSSQTIYFGNYPYVAPPQYSVTGMLYDDIAFPGNYSSQLDPPLSGWVMTIKGTGGSLPDVSTNSTGYFTFNNVTAGTYTITPLPSQGGWVNGTMSPLTVTITNQSVTGLMFGYYYNGNSSQGYSISGTVFNDTNRDGIYDGGDGVLANWYILLNNGNGTLLSAETDSNGYYTFTGLSAGNYTITNTPPSWASAYVSTTSMSISVPVTTASVSNINFGEFYDNFTVSGYVYLDVNNNGVYDPGIDFPLSGWTLSLTNSSGAQTYATTNSAGFFQFIDNPACNYTLSVFPKAGWNSPSSININLQNSSYSVNFNESRAFYEGLYTTYTAAEWSGNPSQLLTASFTQVYNSTGFVEIGIPGLQGYNLEYSNISLMLAYLANTLTPLSPLTAQPSPALNNPGTPAGEFGADVLALQLNVNYSNAGVGMNPGFGSLTYYSYPADSLTGDTVSQILGVANQVLGGNSSAMPSGYNINSLDALVESLNSAFSSSNVAWAQAHLF